MFCYKCGKSIPDESEFCFSCGVKVINPERISSNTGDANLNNAAPQPMAPPVTNNMQLQMNSYNAPIQQPNSTRVRKVCPKCNTVFLTNVTTCNTCGTGLLDSNYISPVITTPVNNTLVWILAFVPLIGSFFAFGFIVFIIVNIILCSLDFRSIEKAGYDTSKFGSFFLIPVYLYKRANEFGHSLGYFIVWCVTFGISILSDFIYL